MTIAISGTNGITLDGQFNSASSFGFKNRIINGAMVIDQRNAGASVTVNSANNFYGVDRFFGTGQVTDGVFTVQQSTTAPAGFTNSLIATITTADAALGATQQYLVGQSIEGFNVSDLGWGTASAAAVTLSFWVRSSLTGTFGGSIVNSGFNRSYPFTFTITAANTFEHKTVTIAGDTSGTWVTNNGVGLRLLFSLGAGSTYSGTAGVWAGSYLAGATGQTQVVSTNGATFYITGVQLEKGSTATSFDYRPYGTELALCQRYYQKMSTDSRAMSNGYNLSTTAGRYTKPFIVAMRTAPTALETTGTAANYRILHAATATACSIVPAFSGASEYEIEVTGTVASGLTAGQGSALAAAASTNAYLAWSAEL